ncbi:MAG: tagaturonate reductase [Moraxellaceae bacterium]|nr:tagaturonate reductase [Moraxellaceae bacterium]
MTSLNRRLFDSQKFRAEAATPSPKPPVGILQIGDGNFLRAFADWMIDVTNGQGLFNGRVTIAQPLDRGLADKLRAQDGLYTVLLRGLQGGKVVESRRIVSCVDDALNPYADWAAMLAKAADPATRFVISNTTEAGIAYVEEALDEARCPQGFPAKVAALLLHRFKTLGGSAATGLVFLPCELIEANGSNLRQIVLKHAQDWKLPTEFVAWVQEHNHFCNTLVDRIVPGFPAGEADAQFAEQGYDDPLMVAAEPFHLWVIEGPSALAEEFPLHKAGLDVIWTDDLQPYRTRKVRVLNGAHTASALAAYLASLDTVLEMTSDAEVSAYLQKLMFDEIVPCLDLPDAERMGYARTIMERFANPHIRHELISISLNSVSKWQVRVLPTVKDHVREHGQAPAALAFSLAALLAFYRGRFDERGDYVGARGDKSYVIRDNPDVLGVWAEAWRSWEQDQDTAALVGRVLGDVRLWGEDLKAVPGLADKVAQPLETILREGMRPALRALLA